MNRKLATVAVALLIGLAGCAGMPGGEATAEPTAGEEPITAENSSAGATDVNQTLQITVGESTNGTELTAVGATYPRENFTVDSAQHSEIFVGVDTDDDGEVEETFEESAISGVNNNAYSFDVTLDTDYTLESGDTVVFRYTAIDNPEEPGEYTVDVRLNDEQTATANVTIE